MRRLSITVEKPEIYPRQVYGWGAPDNYLTNTLDWALSGTLVLDLHRSNNKEYFILTHIYHCLGESPEVMDCEG